MTQGRFQDLKLSDIPILAESIEKEIDRRRIQLWFHRYLYYKLGENILSDYDYDKLELEYKLLRKEYPKVNVHSYCPLEHVGYDMDRITEGKVLQLVKYWKDKEK